MQGLSHAKTRLNAPLQQILHCHDTTACSTRTAQPLTTSANLYMPACEAHRDVVQHIRFASLRNVIERTERPMRQDAEVEAAVQQLQRDASSLRAEALLAEAAAATAAAAAAEAQEIAAAEHAAAEAKEATAAEQVAVRVLRSTTKVLLVCKSAAVIDSRNQLRCGSSVQQ